MGRIISLEHLKRTIFYLKDLGLDLHKEHERNPYDRLTEYSLMKMNINEDENFEGRDKKEVINVLEHLEDLAQESLDKKGYGL